MPAAATPAKPSNPTRAFGRFQLRQLLGKSAGTMAWLAFDPNLSEDVVLTLPRVQPVEAAGLEAWMRDVRFAARLNHPNLAPVLEIGVQDHWPFVVVACRGAMTLGNWLAAHPNAPLDQLAGWVCGMLQGLAFAHEAGAAHLDLQLHSVLIDERGTASVMALAAAGTRVVAQGGRTALNERAMPMDPNHLRDQRAAGERDVLACGVLLHHLLAGQPALEQADVALVIERMAPIGRELVRLPWATPLPVPEALRAIANRCTSGQDRLRYRSARTLLGALSGWRDAHADDEGGPLALLLDRLHSVGHLPALPGLAARVARITGAEGQRTDDIAEQVLRDMALTFELLRTLNSAQVQGTQIAGNGPVLTLRRIISLIGVNGVRLASNALRAWPGPLDAQAAASLQTAMDKVRLAAHTAQALRPAGYDPQVVYLITVLQNLGRLMVRYHFADEAEQIQALMQPAPPLPSAEPGASAQPGLKEELAAFAVLGVDIESLGLAVARQWGLPDEVLHMIRRLPVDAAVRRPDNDGDTLRIVSSAANEAVDVIGMVPQARLGAALAQVALRYARVLHINARDLHEALTAGRDAMRQGTAAPIGSPRGPAGAAAEEAAQGRADERAPEPADASADTR
ncbi:hypothetical protein BH11PSE9_BH11PSE9_33460 [soil metagenome]